jgi:hypothetical protein
MLHVVHVSRSSVEWTGSSLSDGSVKSAIAAVRVKLSANGYHISEIAVFSATYCARHFYDAVTRQHSA